MSLRQAAEAALEVLETLNHGDNYKTHNAATALRQALAMENFSEVNQELEQALAQEQKREWVGLTGEERDWCINGTAWVGEEKEVRVKIVKAIEAKLKEKNT